MQIIFLPEVDSTQLYVKRKILKGDICENTIVYAKNQTAGIGRNNNIWIDGGDNNIKTTFVYRLNLSLYNYLFEHSNVLSLQINRVIIDSIKDYLFMVGAVEVPLFSKWINDIWLDTGYVNGKIGGMLIEFYYNFLIIGLGFNLDHPQIIKEQGVYGVEEFLQIYGKFEQERTAQNFKKWQLFEGNPLPIKMIYNALNLKMVFDISLIDSLTLLKKIFMDLWIFLKNYHPSFPLKQQNHMYINKRVIFLPSGGVNATHNNFVLVSFNKKLLKFRYLIGVFTNVIENTLEKSGALKGGAKILDDDFIVIKGSMGQCWCNI